MKRILFLLLFLSGFSKLYAQQVKPQDVNKDSIYTVVDKAPEFKEGDVYEWLGRNIVYPASAIGRGVEGRVFVSFVVERDGSVSNVTLLRGVDSCLDKEAVRVVSSMPKWYAGRLEKMNVRVKLMLPINFKLMDIATFNKLNKVYCDTCVEKRAEFSPEWKTYFESHMYWTKEALENHAQGNVVVSFIIEKDGSLSDIQVVRYDNTAYMLRDAAIDVVYQSQRIGKWTPGYVEGKPVRVKKVLRLDYIMRDFQRYKVSKFDPAQPIGN